MTWESVRVVDTESLSPDVHRKRHLTGRRRNETNHPFGQDPDLRRKTCVPRLTTLRRNKDERLSWTTGVLRLVCGEDTRSLGTRPPRWTRGPDDRPFRTPRKSLGSSDGWTIHAPETGQSSCGGQHSGSLALNFSEWVPS